MARYDPKVLKTSRISKLMPYNGRYRLEDDALQASVKRSGVLMPVVVTEEDRPVVISGHKRVHAARILKIKELPVFVAGKMRPKEAFLLNLVSNWKQGYSEMDRAKALGKAAREFHFSKREMLAELMPLLGLPEDKASLEFYLKADQCPPSLKDLVEDGQLPARGVASLLKLSKIDQDYFSKNIGAKAKLTSSQLLQAGEWLVDILRATGKTLEGLLRKHRVSDVLDVKGMDSRIKADRFFACIRRLRFPEYSLYLEEFEERRADILRNAKEFRLEPVQGFEEPGFELQARVRTPGELDHLLRKLSEKRSALNSLFEIVL